MKPRRPAFLSALGPTFALAVLLATAAAPAVSLSAQATSAPGTAPGYEIRAASPDGTGKFYMGREIALVMGYQGAEWLERPTREQEERTHLFVQRVELQPTDVVAEIGAGTGYVAFPIAERVPQGKVLAVDIQPQMLAIMNQKKAELGVDNLETVLGTEKDPGLPKAGVNLIYIVDAYHEFSYPFEMGQAMFESLKPGGRLILLEYRGEDPSIPIKELHKMTEAQARAEMAVVGFQWVRTDEYLPEQHVLIFQKP
jgi:precorrin-6B methylase 2